MYVLKGFVQIQDFISNVPTVVAPVGEMSTWSLTYSRSPGDYVHSAVPGYRLISMLSKDSRTGAVAVPPTLVYDVLTVVRSLVIYAQGHFLPYTLDDFRATITATYKSSIDRFLMGPLVTVGDIALPEYVEWASVSVPDAKVRIWLVDDAFARQYDEYEIAVIPPVSVLDDLFGNPAKVYQALAEWPIDALMVRVQDAKHAYPETFTRVMSHPYVFTDVDTPPLTVHWPVLIYGREGDYIDAIKEAINQYVLEHSAHSHDEWAVRSPELFKRTEFMILPRWDRYSIPDLAVETGLYSSLVDPMETVAFAQRELTFYPSAWIPTHLTLTPHPYKGLSLCIVDGPDNLPGKAAFRTLFPDYLAIATTSLDFNRMQLETREWLLKLNEMLIFCETLNDYTVIPEYYRKVRRANKLYLAYLHQGVNYLVAAKSNYS